MSSLRAGLQRVRLQSLSARLRQEWIDPGRIAGCHWRVARHGAIIGEACLGMMDIARQIPLRSDAIYRIYSMTKSITAAALLMLHEQGRFELDDPVARFIPSWREQRVWVSGEGASMLTRAPSTPMTVRHLITHCSGLTYGGLLTPPGVPLGPVDSVYQELGADPRRPESLEVFVNKLAQVPLRFDPGSAWTYSLGLEVCGHLVALLSGQPFDEFLRQHIFEPLGMADTGFHVPPNRLHRLTTCYVQGPDGLPQAFEHATADMLAQPPALCSGGGGLLSTMADYHRFAEMLRGRGALGAVRILQPDTVALMARNHLPDGVDLASCNADGPQDPGQRGVAIGLGLSSVMEDAVRDGAGIGSFSWDGMASTIYWVDPAADLVVLLLAQLVPGATPPSPIDALRRLAREEIYAAVVA